MTGGLLKVYKGKGGKKELIQAQRVLGNSEPRCIEGSDRARLRREAKTARPTHSPLHFCVSQGSGRRRVIRYETHPQASFFRESASRTIKNLSFQLCLGIEPGRNTTTQHPSSALGQLLRKLETVWPVPALHHLSSRGDRSPQEGEQELAAGAPPRPQVSAQQATEPAGIGRCPAARFQAVGTTHSSSAVLKESPRAPNNRGGLQLGASRRPCPALVAVSSRLQLSTGRKQETVWFCMLRPLDRCPGTRRSRGLPVSQPVEGPSHSKPPLEPHLNTTLMVDDIEGRFRKSAPGGSPRRTASGQVNEFSASGQLRRQTIRAQPAFPAPASPASLRVLSCVLRRRPQARESLEVAPSQ
jgi:hypothetical protein